MPYKSVNLWTRIGTEFVEVLYKVDDANPGKYLQGVTLDADPLPVLLSPSEDYIGSVGGKSTTKSVEFTRENNATPYSIGDVISGSAASPLLYELPSIMRVNGGTGLIVNARIEFDVKLVAPQLRLHFFNAPDAIVSGDNLPYQEKYVDGSKRIGYIDFPAMSTATNTTDSDMSSTMIGNSSAIPVHSTANSKSIWVCLQSILSNVTLTALSKVKIFVTVLND